ncbi:hypothetical protein AB5I41_02740 [Sphingomonas sp. MMS24-JH45]
MSTYGSTWPEMMSTLPTASRIGWRRDDRAPRCRGSGARGQRWVKKLKKLQLDGI